MTLKPDISIRPACLGAGHDGGWYILPGRNVTNPRIGFLAWEDDDPSNPGWCVRLDGREIAPVPCDDPDEIVAALRAAGWELDEQSMRELLEAHAERQAGEAG